MERSVSAIAPGRAELSGNRTHYYNEGLALAAAIDCGVIIRAEKLDADFTLPGFPCLMRTSISVTARVTF